MQSNAPAFIKLSTALLLILDISTFLINSLNVLGSPLVSLAEIIASTTDSPTLLTPISPNLMPSSVATKSEKLSCTEGGKTSISISLQFLIYFAMAVASPITDDISDAMNSLG